ncbi:MAG: hypothetical protein IPK60_13275 [Sandaracinaceae bacterium]|nr:hypothetical protein [Sandaracinaceae bacterium]
MRTLAVTLAVLLLTLCSACKVTEEDIENWKGTMKGPGKLVAVVLTPKYSMELRSRAAIALVEMERNDIEGIVELQHALRRLDEPTRIQLIDAMKDPLITIMRGGASAPAGGAAVTTGPTPLQIRAKDAGFLLITDSSAATRTALTNAVVGWYVEDFNGRALSGKFSAEQVVRQLGAPAATVLVSALNEHMPKEAIIKLSELIGQLGETATKATAATRLIAIERAMESDEFLNWVKGKIRAQMSAGGGRVDENRVNAGAVLNRETFINDGALPAMKFLADQPVVANRLIEIAASAQQSETRRTRALLALEGKATEAQLEALLNIALDANTPAGVRDNAFDRIGDVRSTGSLARLWPLITAAGTEQRLRWRVGELVLGIGGGSVVAEFISKLPAAAGAEYAPEELDGYAQKMGQMTPAPTDAIRAQLQSPRWYMRVIALRYFARKGVASDEAAMQALTRDSAPVHGPANSWPASATVGTAATEAIAFMHERLTQAADEAAH